MLKHGMAYVDGILLYNTAGLNEKAHVSDRLRQIQSFGVRILRNRITDRTASFSNPSPILKASLTVD
jgi:hypothetical protein